jgi:superfamily I DNA/RNA helicase
MPRPPLLRTKMGHGSCCFASSKAIRRCPRPISTSSTPTSGAVEHGVCGHGVCDPATDAAPALLVIAGAGSGKTSTLAYRVVHLAASGVDPRRILLMTFSRRAAVEMTRRVQRIGNEAFGANRSVQGGAVAGALTGALSWAGTFHAIGARLLREHAHEIGLDPAFTIHDREDSADLMNLVRHDLRPRKAGFPPRRPASRSTPAPSMPSRTSRRVIG